MVYTCYNNLNKTGVLWKTNALVATKYKIDYFQYKGHSQGYKVFDLGVILKGFISWVYMPNMKPLSLKASVTKRRGIGPIRAENSPYKIRKKVFIF